ncbi:hypothetical protein IMCC3317_33830 [Kordia antarctica]|uniref:Uncharacterized protein n=1 Tax=Kordia antarctica TaxID=1218801 RepID=A0A7L4ZNC1_9FLAO|nr:hypothetical protein [Kordia antarctica]QHI38000.1 hypothetical protein IMCC3317_33830 [Kordia antarctica]
MSGVTKNTIQKILLIALSAMTVAMVLISVFNYKDNRQKSEYLDKENVLVQEELTEIIKSYDHLTKHNNIDSEEVIAEKTKAKELLKKIRQTVLNYETIITYRKQLLVLRKSNQQLQHNFDDDSISFGKLNTFDK